MAGEQDILSLGLDISQFSAQKKALLLEYIEIFKKLSKYDGKIFNPIAGDGLTKLNTSLQETNRLLDDMNTRLYSIQVSNNAVAQSITSGTNAIRTQASSMNVLSNATQGASNAQQKFVVNTYAAKSSLEGIGKSLTQMLTYLRYAAYILPGIGIAGIFNLAYEAIKSAADAIFDFVDHGRELQEVSRDINNALAEQIKSWDELVRLQKEYYNNFLSINEFSDGSAAKIQVLRDKESDLSGDVSRGYESGKLLAEQLGIAQKKYSELLDDVARYDNKSRNAGSVLEFNLNTQLFKISQDIQTQLDKMKSATALSEEAQRTIARKGVDDYGGIHNKDSHFTEAADKADAVKQAQLKKEEQDAIFKAAKANYDSLNKLLSDYYRADKELKDKQLEIDKFNSDQERKILVENIRAQAQTELKIQQDILNNDKKFHDDKKAAILKEYEEEKKIALANRINVTGTKENPNVGATKADIINATVKETADIKQADIKKNTELEKNDVEFYQRKIKALTDTNINEVKAESDKNKAIYNNQEKSLSERLRAYQKFVEDEQKIADYQLALDIQRGAAKAGGITSLTPEESAKLESDNAKAKEKVVANSEKEIYDITHSSLEAILDDVDKFNKSQDEIDLTGHILALRRINKEYDDKKISLKNYRKEKAKIELQYEKSDLDQQIANDKEAIQNLQEAYYEKINLELQYREQLLQIVQVTGSEQAIAEAKAAVKAAQDAVNDAFAKIKEARDKLHQDELKKEQKTPPAEKEDKGIYEALRISQRILDDVRRLYDERIEMQIRFLEKKQQLLDEEYGSEQDAIEKSSLSLKDKQALEIQIQEQKHVSDENASREEANLRIKEFEFDKKIALAKAAIGIAAAIVKDGITSPKSIADAIIGAAEIATILATRPPSFGEGVIDFKGGLARTGEKGAEAIKEPGKPWRVVTKETIGYLKPGSDVIPLNTNHPEFGVSSHDDSWEQTRYLARQMKKNKNEIKNIFKPTIVINGAFEQRKNQILGR